MDTAPISFDNCSFTSIKYFRPFTTGALMVTNLCLAIAFYFDVLTFIFWTGLLVALPWYMIFTRNEDIVRSRSSSLILLPTTFFVFAAATIFTLGLTFIPVVAVIDGVLWNPAPSVGLQAINQSLTDLIQTWIMCLLFFLVGTLVLYRHDRGKGRPVRFTHILCILLIAGFEYIAAAVIVQL